MTVRPEAVVVLLLSAADDVAAALRHPLPSPAAEGLIRAHARIARALQSVVAPSAEAVGNPAP